ncbi:MAG: hypothetical protein FJY75_04730 [Candidatus Eisenbacteria bacterium]|uniref:C4-type zinc ribbon domain-containing protein n=1 Tax=Eiseniibacteriota bacterium TaxID=2212470 RepID=A0A937XAQ4_UNCEI|nr:hypothetical protein [Candidatus Eisenbacteria bacterium]
MEARREQVAILQELMEADERLRELKRRVDAQAAEKQRRRSEADLVAGALARDKERLAAAEKRRRDATREVEIAQAHKRDSEKKLSAVKTNEEYRALLKEIAAAEEKTRALEEAILRTLEEEETARRAGAAVAVELREKEQAAAEEAGRFESELTAAREEQQGLLARRAEFVARLPAGARAKYERLWSSKGDTAIVPVEGGACGGCHYRLPPQTVNEVRAGERMMLCEGCGRILVWSEPR